VLTSPTISTGRAGVPLSDEKRSLSFSPSFFPLIFLSLSFSLSLVLSPSLALSPTMRILSARPIVGSSVRRYCTLANTVVDALALEAIAAKELRCAAAVSRSLLSHTRKDFRTDGKRRRNRMVRRLRPWMVALLVEGRGMWRIEGLGRWVTSVSELPGALTRTNSHAARGPAL